MSTLGDSPHVASNQGGGAQATRERSGWLQQAVLGLVFSAVLVAVYRLTIQPAFAYAGLRAGEADPLTVVFSAVAVVLVSSALRIRSGRPSDVAVVVICCVFVFPTLALTPHLGYLDSTVQSQAVFGVSAAILLLIGLNRSGQVLPLAIPVSADKALLILGTLLVLGAGAFLAEFGVPSSLPSLLDVYETRLDYRDELASAGGWVGPLVGLLVLSLPQSLLAMGLEWRRRSLIAVGLLLVALVYGATGFKSPLFALGLVVVLWLIGRRRLRPFTIMAFFLGLMISAWAVDSIIGGILYSSFATRRLMVVPAMITNVYVDFFTENPQSNWAGLLPFIEYPYERPIPFVIGFEVFGEPQLHANANAWADAFSAFGWVGLVFVTVLIAGYLRILDGAASGLPMRLTGALAGAAVLPITNSALPTSLITHGMILTVLLLAVLPRSLGFGEPHPGAEAPDTTRSTRVGTRRPSKGCYFAVASVLLAVSRPVLARVP